MNAVERVNEYLDIPSGPYCQSDRDASVDAAVLVEPPAIIPASRPPAYWPSNTGGISVNNLVLKYSPELEPVLKNVSFEIKVSHLLVFTVTVFYESSRPTSLQPNEKIGLVGRTGSGKSTLALSFFRFVDPEEGKIHIDGIDIITIGLEDLRSRLTIIPQGKSTFVHLLL